MFDWLKARGGVVKSDPYTKFCEDMETRREEVRKRDERERLEKIERRLEFMEAESKTKLYIPGLGCDFQAYMHKGFLVIRAGGSSFKLPEAYCLSLRDLLNTVYPDK